MRGVLRLEGRDLAVLCEKIKTLKQEFPRSQIYRLIRRAVTEGALIPPRPDKSDSPVATQDKAPPTPVDKIEADLRFVLANLRKPDKETNLTVEDILLPALGTSEQTPLLALPRLAELWDYIDPAGAPLLLPPTP